MKSQIKKPVPEIFTHFAEEVSVTSPGRINMIGEHTDYNNGLVMPTAIDKKIFLKLKVNNTGSICRVYSETFDSFLEFDLENFYPSEAAWENYILGVVNEIKQSGKELKGFDCLIRSELPIGAGISSSAALECGLASGLNALFDLGLSKMEIVRLSQKAEHNFVGSNCGIMDQYASVMSRENHLILLDCKTLEAEFIPADFKNCKVLLLNTKVSHSLADSEYNTRRKECEDAVKIIQQHYPEVKSLREVDLKILEELQGQLPQKSYQRSKYVIMENDRVKKAAKAMRSGDLKHFGNLMYESHQGLQHDYEVSCPELDFLVDHSRNKRFIYGSRMMGGGFGGCTINLIEAEEIDAYIEEVSEAYFGKFGVKPEPISIFPSKGTEVSTKEFH